MSIRINLFIAAAFPAIVIGARICATPVDPNNIPAAGERVIDITSKSVGEDDATGQRLIEESSLPESAPVTVPLPAAVVSFPAGAVVAAIATRKMKKRR